MDKFTCNECGTENESEYIYCKNCGAPLQKEPEESNTDVKQASCENPNFSHQSTAGPTFISDEPNSDENPNFSHQTYSNNYQPESHKSDDKDYSQSFNQTTDSTVVDSIDGIPTDEVALFIGGKSQEIMPKFIKMELTRSKINWCWPAAILGLILGPMGSALWFFYRKMYKTALILLAVGVLVTACTTALTYDTTAKTINGVFDAFKKSDAAGIISGLDNIDIKESAADRLADLIERLSAVIACIITGLFGYYLYKNHAVKKILGYRSSLSDVRYYRMGLSAIGGTSGGMLALGIVAIVGVGAVESTVKFILSLL